MIKVAMVLGVAALGAIGVANAQALSVSIGGEYTSGDYGGGGDTDVFYAPVALGLDAGDWSIRASVPYLD
ncbi:MAG: hypothetical protein VXW22_10420 [Pseudomonadota bacterium]|nr:hypothetical protein [Pseudomonadota bacterium]